MSHALVIHEEAAAELEAIYDYIADRAGPDVAWAYIDGVQRFLAVLCDFPERGTIRENGPAAGLRVIGYRRQAQHRFQGRCRCGGRPGLLLCRPQYGEGRSFRPADVWLRIGS